MDSIKIREGKLSLYVPNPDTYRLTAKMPVFYNPEMRLNRDISIILLKSLKRKMKCLDLLAASGARGLRIAAEVPGSTVTLNDANPSAIKLIEKNGKLNRLNVEVIHNSANRLLRSTKRIWDYIDVDPFGTPMPFLEAAISRLSKNGIIGISATDTSALCGTYPSACARKYSSVSSLRCPIMHELGLRILIYAVQGAGKRQGVYLKPIFSHSTRHYMRVYLQRVTTDPTQKGYISYNFKTGAFKARKTKPKKDFAGPLWLGNLWDTRLVKKMISNINLEAERDKIFTSNEANSLVRKLYDESQIQSIGFYDIHALAKTYKVDQLPRFIEITKGLSKLGYQVSRTHITPTGLRTDAPIKEILKVLIG